MGLLGADEIPPSIVHFDVIEYLDGLLTGINGQTDDIITLICERDDSTRFNCLLKELARKDSADVDVQKRKWRACLLEILLDNINENWLQGLLELMEFWVSMGMPDDCPQTFPSSDKKKRIQDYFTQASYESSLSRNREWLDKEILSIIKLEEGAEDEGAETRY